MAPNKERNKMIQLTLKEIKEIIKKDSLGFTVQFGVCSLKQYNSYVKQIEEYKKNSSWHGDNYPI